MFLNIMGKSSFVVAGFDKHETLTHVAGVIVCYCLHDNYSIDE